MGRWGEGGGKALKSETLIITKLLLQFDHSSSYAVMFPLINLLLIQVIPLIH
ncbi:MAG: hypothetical protein F6K58_12090 [Symploca sp. SIO2E9]|nr:hypothetical protein [Symploca sp. SIO2E9]